MVRASTTLSRTARPALGGARAALAAAAVVLFALLVTSHAAALTPPIAGAVAFPANVKLYLPFPAGSVIRVLSGYSPSGGSSLHADTNACCKANDYYALDLVYDTEPNSGKGLPILAPLPGKVVRAGWATSGWANYGLRVILEHDLGDGHVYHSLYAHMNAIDPAVVEGATVAPGQALGELGQSCQGQLSCGSFSTPHLHWAIHRDSLVGGSGTGGSYGGNAVVPEPLDGVEDLVQGTLIVSTNTGTVACGDGYCNGDETHATCAADCPICEPVPPAGRIVDETDLCFAKGGNPQYWHTESAGWDGSRLWTYATDAAVADNFGVWTLTFDEAGDYALDVYVEPGSAKSTQASYALTHAGATESVVVDQSAASGWAPLGTFAFAAGPDQSVRLEDDTGEPVAAMHELVFDALRLTRIGGTGGAGGAGAGAGGGQAQGGGGGATATTGGPSGDGDATPAAGRGGGGWGGGAAPPAPRRGPGGRRAAARCPAGRGRGGRVLGVPRGARRAGAGAGGPRRRPPRRGSTKTAAPRPLKRCRAFVRSTPLETRGPTPLRVGGAGAEPRA